MAENPTPLGHLQYDEFTFQPVVPIQPAMDLFNRVRSGDVSFETAELGFGVAGCVSCLIASRGGPPLTGAKPSREVAAFTSDPNCDLKTLADVGESILGEFRSEAGDPASAGSFDFTKLADLLALILSVVTRVLR